MFVIALALLVAHSFAIVQIIVDNTSLALIAVILVSPFISSLKKVKVGDLFEAEIDPKEVQKVKDEVETKVASDSTSEPPHTESEAVSNIRVLAETDHILALAKLRIELEKLLTRIYRIAVDNNADNRHLSLGKLVNELTLREVLPKDISGPIKEVIFLCNRAVHGEDVRKQDAKSIVETGISLLVYLNRFTLELAVKPMDTGTISHDELRKYQNGKYRVVTVVPYSDAPIKNYRILTQDDLDELIAGYEEYGEFIVEVSFVRD